MPEVLHNQTPVLGGAGAIYQRKAEGPWYLYFWLKKERFFVRIKQFRRMATRYEKLAVHYLAIVTLVATVIWLRELA